MESKPNLIDRFLGTVEKAGNRLPDPVSLFAILAFLVVIASAIVSALGVSFTHPASGEPVQAVNLLSIDNLRRMLVHAVDNFTEFPPLGLVLVTMIGVGVAERSGLVTTGLRLMVLSVPRGLLTAALVFGGIMSSMAADAGYVVLTPLGALLYASVGRHPLAGLTAAFAGVSAGFSANLLLTSLDPLLSGLTTAGAQLVDPDYVVQPTANYFFMVFSVGLLTLTGTLVNNKIVEPRLGEWKPKDGQNVEDDLETASTINPQESKALKVSGLVALGLLATIIVLLIPENGIFRTEADGMLPFFESLVMQIMLGFLIVGLVYGWMAGSIRSDKDAAKMMGDSLATMGGYIVLAFFAAQFVAYFKWSNLGLIVAIGGAETLDKLGLTGLPLIIGFVLMAGLVNIFIGSASAKWAIMAPVFVPMLMLLGYSPELTQLAYRIGDSTTNIITPLMPYFPIVISFAKKYDPDTGIGTLLSAMIPYSVVFTIVWMIVLVTWLLLGIPIGPDAPVDYNIGG
jgi:aminobenzoyl-glutamate transport protein